MNTEQAALEFVVGLTSRGVDSSVTKLVNAFAKVASAAQFAHNAIQGENTGGGGGGGGGGTVAPGGSGRASKELTKTVNAQISVLTMLKSHMVSLGVTAVGKVWHVMTQGAGIVFDALVEHEKEMIKMRKSLAMNAEEARKFSGNMLSATALYGGNIATVRHLAAEMHRGLVRTDQAAADLAGRLANLETRSGMSGENMMKAADLWRTNLKILTDDEFDKSVRVLKSTSYTVKANANAILDYSASAEGIYSNWQSKGKDAAQKRIRDVQTLGLAFESQGGKAKELVGLLAQGGDRASSFGQRMNQFGGDFKSATRQMLTLIEAVGEEGGARERIMKEYGMDTKIFLNLKAAIAKWDEVEANYNAESLKSAKQLMDEEKGRMNNLEKMGETLTLLKTEAMAVGSAFANWAVHSEGVNDLLMASKQLLVEIATLFKGLQTRGNEADLAKDAVQAGTGGFVGKASMMGERLTSWDALGAGASDILKAPGRWWRGEQQLQDTRDYEIGKAVGPQADFLTQHRRTQAGYDKNIAAGLTPLPNPSIPPTGGTLGLSDVATRLDTTNKNLEKIGKDIGGVRDNTKKGPNGSSSTGTTQSSLRK